MPFDLLAIAVVVSQPSWKIEVPLLRLSCRGEDKGHREVVGDVFPTNFLGRSTFLSKTLKCLVDLQNVEGDRIKE